jgi:hypothetical protein
MFNDRIALHGFGKLFKHFFITQLDYVNSIRQFIILRGGSIETPHFIVFPFPNYNFFSSCKDTTI